MKNAQQLNKPAWPWRRADKLSAAAVHPRIFGSAARPAYIRPWSRRHNHIL